MPPSRGRRPKPSRATAKIVTDNKTIVKENKVPINQQPGLPKRIWQIWQISWGVLGPILTLIGFFFLLKPKVLIEPSANLDPSQSLATQFRVLNAGNLPVYNVTFGCGYGSPMRIHDFTISGSAIMPVPVLQPGFPVTRSCAVSSVGVELPSVQITANYQWPLIRKNGAVSAFFRVVQGAGGHYFLLPDLPPAQ
jgi:hypothetical protein